MVVVCCAIALPRCVNTAAMTNDSKSILRVCIAVFLFCNGGFFRTERPDEYRSGRSTARLLLDHLIRLQYYRWRYGKAERRGGPAVYDHLELGRKLHREIARLLAAQDAIHIGGGATKDVYHVGSVGEQTTVSGRLRKRIDRRHVVSGRRRYVQRATHTHESSGMTT